MEDTTATQALAEACEQLDDLWHTVPSVISVEPYVYPAGTEAIWLHVDREMPRNDAYPEEWMGYPVVLCLDRRTSHA